MDAAPDFATEFAGEKGMKKLNYFLLAMSLINSFACVLLSNFSNKVVAAQAAEIQDLKWANAVVKRSKTLPKFGGMNYEAVEKAAYWTGCPDWIIGGVRRHENGPAGLDCGYHGKTKFVVDHFEVKDWQYAEAGRFATRIAWEYCLHQGRVDDFFAYLGSRYTGPPFKKSQAWGKSVHKLALGEKELLTNAH